MLAKLFILIYSLLKATGTIAQDPCSIRLNDEYLDLTNGGQRVHLGPLELRSMRAALKALELPDLEAGPAAIQRRLAQLDNKSKTRALDARLLMALDELANPKADCTHELTLDWLKLAAFTELAENSKRNKRLACYLTHFGAQKFAKCAKELELEFEANFRADSPMGHLLDDYFIQAMRSSGFEVKSGADLSKQIHKLQMSDSNESTLIQLAARWAEQIARDKLVQEFLSYQAKAARFMPSGRHLFMLINLARDLGKFAPKDANLNKLNEFHRLVCVGQLKFRDENLGLLCQFVQLQAQLLMLD